MLAFMLEQVDWSGVAVLASEALLTAVFFFLFFAALSTHHLPETLKHHASHVMPLVMLS